MSEEALNDSTPITYVSACVQCFVFSRFNVLFVFFWVCLLLCFHVLQGFSGFLLFLPVFLCFLLLSPEGF